MPYVIHLRQIVLILTLTVKGETGESYHILCAVAVTVSIRTYSER